MICWKTNPGIKPSSRISHSQLCCSLVEIPVATNQEKFGIFLLHSCCKPGEIWIFPLFFLPYFAVCQSRTVAVTSVGSQPEPRTFPIIQFPSFFFGKSFSQPTTESTVWLQ